VTIDQVYRLMQYVIAKNQNGYLSPDEFNIVINTAQNSFMNYLLGEFQQYQPQRPTARVAYSQNEITRQRLIPFIKERVLDIDSSGFSNYPVDYQETDAMMSLYGFNRIRFIQQDSQFSYINSVIDPIATNPVFLIKREGFQFYPTDLYRVNLSYVGTPQELEWAYISNMYGIPIWDQANSTDPQWFDVDMLEIIARALRIVGVNLQANDVSAYAEEIKSQGQ